ncbi:alpha/beta hydrolase [Niastella yeongjuensis]|uniref:Alpha/beta hydrolase n=1 Tax=Niastella yeongjuensis TaxID=354355 RepID=A0A1V9EES1_9BACT|nr:alpha/beta fold hydrolase [Niastella yeongjuensis]OQP44562.1 alpha/beta hydrolase [Niastella yeongjuensis]SEO83362.1 Pimeloyl-ACP methyl ester carboxylesterase [Niastella yeongjuensis]
MQHLILLHGALGSDKQFQSLVQELDGTFQLHTFNLHGHGGLPLPSHTFSIELFSEQVARYIQDMNIEKANIFGYSMGGYIAMYLAKQMPDKINKIVTLATKFYWDEKTASKEVKLLDSKIIQEKLPAFATQLQQRHAPADWVAILDKTTELLLNLGKNNTLQLEDYNSITTPSLVLLGDRDKMVTLEETLAVYKQLPNALFGVLPGTPHIFEQVNVSLLAYLIKGFMK